MRDLDFIRWRDQARKDIQVTFTILIVLGLFWYIGTSEHAISAPTVPEHGQNEVWLSEGDYNEHVTEVQTILASHGWTIVIDGVYGPQTHSVVKQFQSASGLRDDGIVGPVTWSALQSVAPTAQRKNQLTVSTPDLPMPIERECDTWRPLIEHFEIPWDWARPILWRESNCTNAHARDSDDHSHGAMQVNRLSRSMARWLDEAGYDHDYMHTTIGALHAAGALYQACGRGPWSPPYSCNGVTNGKLPHRLAWP